MPSLTREQLDIEMSFAGAHQVMQVIETLLVDLWKTTLSISMQLPFKHMTYNQAMSTYGSDKPDLRLGMEVCPLEVIKIPSGTKLHSS
jgi:aspartyl-tRNA synthetase